MNNLTMLSFGAGQDSTAILYKLVYDKEFRNKYAPKDLVVVMADTMNEHDETNRHRQKIEVFCTQHNIDFFFLDPEDWASGEWKLGYVGFLDAGNRIGSKCFPKTCTDKLKIQPIYKWLEDYVHTRYGTVKVGRKEAIKEFVAKNSKIRVLLGIARGEETRASTNESSVASWMRYCIDKQYPLIELEMNRQDCQDYIASVGHVIPPPSNCILCPFMSYQELLHLYRFEKKWYDTWVRLEANKIMANSHVENNMGVWGKKLLPQALEVAIEKYGHMTNEELRDYKMSHGHCVMSKY